MPASPTPPGPRLVRADEAPPPAAAPPRPAGGRAWLLPLIVLVALVAALGWGRASHRAADLEAQVTALTGALEAARSEITARQRHLEAVRGAAAEVEARVVELRALAERSPTAPGALPPEAPGGNR
jgi:hypothetical protein